MKRCYRFYPTADAEQDAIWDYTFQQWGEEQATRYIKGLHEHLQKLADKQLPWHHLQHRAPADMHWTKGVYVSRYQKHLIFFKILDSKTIGIMSILHERMDLPARLMEDLQSL